jgi:hypothetical protein
MNSGIFFILALGLSLATRAQAVELSSKPAVVMKHSVSFLSPNVLAEWAGELESGQIVFISSTEGKYTQVAKDDQPSTANAWTETTNLSTKQEDLDAGHMLAEMNGAFNLLSKATISGDEITNKKVTDILCRYEKSPKTNSFKVELNNQFLKLVDSFEEYNQDCANGPPDWRDACGSTKKKPEKKK